MNTEIMAELATTTQDDLLALHARYLTGELGYEEFLALAVALLVRTAARGTALADVGVAADLTAQLGEPVPTVGLPPPDRSAALASAALVALLASETYRTDPEPAVAVLARAHTLDAVQTATTTAMREHEDVVTGWTRVLNTGACSLCQDLAGEVLPVEADPYHHKGCGCSTRPVTTK